MPQEVVALPILSSTMPSSPFSPSNLHLQSTNPLSPQAVRFTSPDEKEDDFAPSSSSTSSSHTPPIHRSARIGTRFEKPPHSGPGASCYVPQPSRADLKANNGLFGSSTRPYFYKCPTGKPFIDIDGRDCGPRWVRVDPRAHEHPTKSKNGCVVM